MNGEHVETMPAPKPGQLRDKRERETTIQDAAPRMSKSFGRNLVSSKTKPPMQTFLGPRLAFLPNRFRFQIFLFFALFKRLLQKLQYITKVRKNKKANNINHQRWNLRSNQRSLGFRVGHSPRATNWRRHLHKTTRNVKGRRENYKCIKSYLRFYIKTMEMTVASEGREVKLLIGYS